MTRLNGVDSGKLERQYIRPIFLPSVEVTSDADARKREVAMKKNLASSYVSLYAAIFGGLVRCPEIRDIYQILFNARRRFKPDVIDIRSEATTLTEIKTININKKDPFFTLGQIENYSLYLANLIKEGQSFPAVNVGIFTYGKSHERARLSVAENKDIRHKVAETTRDLLVLPFNLFFYLISDNFFSYRLGFDQTSSGSSLDKQSYLLLRARGITKLHSPDGLEFLLRKSRKYPNWNASPYSPLLHLENLRVRKKVSPDNLFIGSYRIKEFPITIYENENPEIWLNSFANNHQQILGRNGLEDLSLQPIEVQEEALRENEIVPISPTDIRDPLPF